MFNWLVRYWSRLGVLPRVLGVVVLVAGVAFAAWTISPLFYNRHVDEAFPAAMPEPQAAIAVESSPTASAEPQPAPTASAEPQPAPTASAEPQPAPTATAPAEPVSLASGSFTWIDRLHYAEGDAAIYRLADGSQVLRLENFNAGNGPDLFIGLSGHPMPRSHDEVYDQGYVELARLKGNQGNQNYELPADLDLSAFQSVVIYCRAFNVVFSTAELR